MHFFKTLSLFALLTTSAFAAPTAEADPGWGQPPKAPKPPGRPPPRPLLQQFVNQNNVCGNNIQPYCCNSDGSSAACSTMNESSTCSTTIVCCNANDSIQVCIGSINVNIVVNIET